MNAGKKMFVCYGVVLGACVLFLAWLLCVHNQPNDRLGFGNTSLLSAQMQEDGNQQLYTAVLPAAFRDEQSLFFKTAHAMVEVSVDGTVVYDYGMGERIAGKSPGTYWHVVSIPAGSDGQELRIHLTSAYDSFSGTNISVQYGSRGDCILTFVSSFLPILVVNFIIITMGAVCLLLCLMAAWKKEKQEVVGFSCIGLFSLTIAVWSLRQCGFLQFLIPNGEILYFVDLHLLFLVLPPLDLFLYSISQTKWKTGFLWIVAAFLLSMVAATAMQFAGVMDIFEMLLFLHGLIIWNGAYMFWVIHRENVEHKGGIVSDMLVPLYTLMSFGVLELVSYYIPMFGGISIFLPLGAMVFILMLIWQQVEGHYQNVLEEQKLLYYEKLANTDLLTGANNRNAYETVLEQLKSADHDFFGVAMFDLNDMKAINDHYGHEKGDEAIKACHELIRQAFGDQGKCYRIGGDEFVFVAFDSMDLAQSALAFDELVMARAEHLDYPFRVALGYAAFDASQDRSFQDTIKRSDDMMYQDKRRKKQPV